MNTRSATKKEMGVKNAITKSDAAMRGKFVMPQIKLGTSCREEKKAVPSPQYAAPSPQYAPPSEVEFLKEQIQNLQKEQIQNLQKRIKACYEEAPLEVESLKEYTKNLERDLLKSWDENKAMKEESEVRLACRSDEIKRLQREIQILQQEKAEWRYKAEELRFNVLQTKLNVEERLNEDETEEYEHLKVIYLLK